MSPATATHAAAGAYNATVHAALHLIVHLPVTLIVYPNLVPAQARMFNGGQSQALLMLSVLMIIQLIYGAGIVTARKIPAIYAKQYTQTIHHHVHSLEL